ncbi:MAG: hypothetical protein A2984_02070 [Omnitrophica WOR_2 bacterium RIFCSPLOWO2_01_FULL_41_12]|nr:MAG: hypothetical protein A2984_02070 [Omnitrophica WOR_2 bacterium RIFCSPLOWO2_01_FULL_41_12]
MHRFFMLFMIVSCLAFYVSADAQDKRDPFIPLVDAQGNLVRDFTKPKAEELATKISLNGISKIKGVLYAIIDGELVKEGQMFGEFKVEKIEPDAVILGFGDKRFELRLEP